MILRASRPPGCRSMRTQRATAAEVAEARPRSSSAGHSAPGKAGLESPTRAYGSHEVEVESVGCLKAAWIGPRSIDEPGGQLSLPAMTVSRGPPRDLSSIVQSALTPRPIHRPRRHPSLPWRRDRQTHKPTGRDTFLALGSSTAFRGGPGSDLVVASTFRPCNWCSRSHQSRHFPEEHDWFNEFR